MRRWRAAPVALGLVAAVGCAGTGGPAGPDVGRPLVATLAEVPLRSFQNQALPGSLADDRGARLGGFSDLYHDPRDGANVFWTVPDRGPTRVDERGLTFEVPGYNPALVKLVADPTGIAVLQQVPIRTFDGRPVSGLPDGPSGGATPLGPDGEVLAFDPNGLDPQGLVRVPDGTFWLAEDNGPSLVHLGRDGRVLERWLPRGRRLAGADYSVTDVLPAALAGRAPERGLASLATTAEGRFLYTMMAAPLASASEREEPRPVRLLQVDTLLARTVAQWVYLPEPARGDRGEPSGRVSALAFVNSNALLALEETAGGPRVYALALDGATSVLGNAYDSGAGAALDGLDAAGLARAGIEPVGKSLVLDLRPAAGAGSRVEGLAIVDGDTISIVTDDGFGLAPPRAVLGFDAPPGPEAAPPAGSRVVTVRLSETLPLGR
jgi:hypothetical protein